MTHPMISAPTPDAPSAQDKPALGSLVAAQGARRRLGVALVGVGGAIGTTVVAGLELLRQRRIGTEGLPLASLPEALTAPLVGYDDIVIGGWDLCQDDLCKAAEVHDVLTLAQYRYAAEALGRVKPWPAVGDARFCRNVAGAHCMAAASHRAKIDVIRADLLQFRANSGSDGLVVVNLGSTERGVDTSSPAFTGLRGLEDALDADSPEVGPAMLYAYAALQERVPYVNFTPSVAAEVPAMIELAQQKGVPVGGKDGKTGQTLLKTVLAPALRARALRVDGWYSTNILGNRDGLALRDEGSLRSKLSTKACVLDEILGYRVDPHIVDIRYYRPRGDNKEAWDNIDVIGFLGRRMQIKVNFLCRDSVLAAPLVIELARLMDLSLRRGERGAQTQFGAFFKQPMVKRQGSRVEHGFFTQDRALRQWLAG